MDMEMNGKGRFAFVIPVYNHPGRIQRVVAGALERGIPVFVVDDGSTDATGDIVLWMKGAMKGVHRLRHERNQGKGAALLTGMAAAAEVADWAIVVDGDGQHDPADAVELVRAAPREGRAIIVGARQGMIGPDVPWTSRFGRKFSNFWIQMAGGPKISDSQSGFRIYPLPETLDLKARSRRFQFEVEILVKA
ncbi:MAG: glycosyltransferase family 2 protein, partial [Desulfobacterales bacterium]|nr:glycosyltransferase family 2 protein [Desulfobacterales bacterium]